MVRVLLQGYCGWGIPRNHPGEALGMSLVPGDADVSGEQPEPRWPSSLVVPAPSLQHHSCVLTAFAFCSMASCCLLGVFLVSGCYLGLLELCIGVALTAEPVWFPGTSVRLAGRPWLVSLGTDPGCF